MARKRYELSFDDQRDAAYIAVVEYYRDLGYPTMDIIRAALTALQNAEVIMPERQAAIPTLGAVLAEAIDRLGDKLAERLTLPPARSLPSLPAAESPSGGIDMNAPRRTLSKRPVAPAEQPAVAFDEADARQRLVASINGFGKAKE